MSSTVNFVVVAPNVAELSNEDIDALVDLHIFGKNEQICVGRLEYHYVSAGGNGAPYWQCDECGAIQRYTAEKHRRAMPAYCTDMAATWKVVERLKACDVQTKIRFELALQTQYHCVLLSLTPRMIAIAALQSIGVIDQAGYVAKREEGR